MKTRNLLILTLSAALSACRGDVQTPGANPAPRGVPVRTATAETRDLENALVLTGTLRPRAQVQIVAEIAARLLKIAKDEGAPVSAGDVLAVLDEADVRLALERARAALAVAEANRAHALAEKERALNLVKTGGITDKDRLAAEVGLQVAEAAHAQAQAESSIAEKQLSRTSLRAPFGGRVAKRLTDPGAMLAVGSPVLVLVDDRVYEFRADVPSADYAKVKVGAAASISSDALPGVVVQGRVSRISPLVNEKTRSFEAIVEVPGKKELVGGLFARATIHVSGVKGAVVVPPSAIVRDDATPGKANAFVVASGKAERRSVGLGVESADAVQVTSGLAAGDVVVLDPPPALGSGAAVEAQSPRPEAK